MPHDFGVIEQAQIDIATLLARLIQLDQLRGLAVGQVALAGHIWDRVMTCDVPRLRGYLEGDVRQLLDQLTAAPGGTPSPSAG